MRKGVIVSYIVKAIERNYDKAMVIAGQYNSIKHELFHTYFGLKVSGSGMAKGLKRKLSVIEKEYIS